MAVIGSLVAQLSLDAAAFVRDLNQAGDTLDKAGRRMATVGRNISTYISAPLIGLGALTLKTSSEFEAGMNKLESVSGAAGTELSKLREEAKKLGAQIEFGKFSAIDAAEGMTLLAQAGFNTNEIIKVMPGLLQLATAANMELGQSADIVSSVLRGYGKTVDELAHVNDVLTKTSIDTNAELRGLGEAMKFVGPIASAAGVNFEEVSAALGLLGNAGIQGEMAGTALRGVLSSILTPTKEAAATMLELGINMTDSAGRILPLVDVLTQLEPHAENAGLFMQLFGERAGPAMAALVAQGSEALDRFATTLENSTGTAAQVASTQLQGFGASMEGLRSSFEGLQIAIGDSGLLEFATDAVKGLAGIVETISQLDPEVLKLGTILAAAAAAGGPLLLFLGAVTVALGALLSPLGLIVLAITGTAGIVAAIYAFRESIGAALTGAIDKVVQAFVTLKNEPLAAVKAMVDGIQDILSVGLTAAFAAVIAPMEKVKGYFDELKDYVVGRSVIPDMVNEIRSWMFKLPDAMIRPAAAAVQGTNAEFDKITSDERLREFESTFVDVFKNAGREIQSTMSNTFEEIYSGGVTSFSDIADSAKDIFARLAAELTTLLILRPEVVLAGLGLGAGPAGGGLGGLLGGGGLFSGLTNAINRFGSQIGFGTAAAQPALPGAASTDIRGFIPPQPGAFLGTGATLSQTLGAGAIGVIGGTVAGGLFGGKGGIGGGIGGGLGAAGGFAFGGPIGGLLGGLGGGLLGGALGGLFGGGNSENQGTLRFSSGAGRGPFGGFTISGEDTFEAPLRALVNTLDKTLADLLTASQEKLGAAAVRALGEFEERFSEADPSAGFAEVLRDRAQAILEAAYADLDFSKVLEGAGSAEEVINRVTAALQTINQYTQVVEGVSPAVLAARDTLATLEAGFDELRASSKDLGLSIKELNQAEREAIRDLRREVRTEVADLLTGGTFSAGAAEFREALATIAEQFDITAARAESLGVSIEGLAEAEAAAESNLRAKGELRILELTNVDGANDALIAFNSTMLQIGADFTEAADIARAMGASQREVNAIIKDGEQAQLDFAQQTRDNAKAVGGMTSALRSGSSAASAYRAQVDLINVTFGNAVQSLRAAGGTVAEIAALLAGQDKALRDLERTTLRGIDDLIRDTNRPPSGRIADRPDVRAEIARVDREFAEARALQYELGRPARERKELNAANRAARQAIRNQAQAEVRAQERAAKQAAERQAAADRAARDRERASAAARAAADRAARDRERAAAAARTAAERERADRERAAAAAQAAADREQRRLAQAAAVIDIENLIASIDFGPAGKFRQELRSINQQFTEARSKAREFGLSVNALNAAETKAIGNLRDQAHKQIASTIALGDRTSGPVQAFKDELEGVGEAFDDARDLARALGRSLNDLNAAEQRAVQNLKEAALEQLGTQALDVSRRFDAILDPLREFQTELRASVASPTEAFRLAREEFERTAALARGGDLAAIANLPQLGKTFLEQATAFGASPGRIAAEKQIQDALRGVIQATEQAQKQAVAGLEAEIRRASDREIDTLNELRTDVQNTVRELIRLRTAIGSARTA